MTIEIRRLTLADLAAIERIERRAYPTPWSRSMFASELAKTSSICLGAFDADAAATKESIDVLEHGHRTRRELAEDLAVPDKRAGRDLRGCIERNDQHSVTRMRLCPSPACSSETAKRAAGSTSRPASGHSTKQTAPSK